MTREELIDIIYEDNTARSCRRHNCYITESEDGSWEHCKKCAEEMLKDYENKIKSDERARVIGIIATRLEEVNSMK